MIAAQAAGCAPSSRRSNTRRGVGFLEERCHGRFRLRCRTSGRLSFLADLYGATAKLSCDRRSCWRLSATWPRWKPFCGARRRSPGWLPLKLVWQKKFSATNPWCCSTPAAVTSTSRPCRTPSEARCDTRLRTLHLLVGPLVFLLFLVIPAALHPYPYAPASACFGESWWWIFEPVISPVTGFLRSRTRPLQFSSPVARILPSYSEELIFLLLGANTCLPVWIRWGLDRRIAWCPLIGVGTSPQRQNLVVVWHRYVVERVPAQHRRRRSHDPDRPGELRFIGIHDRKAPLLRWLIAIVLGNERGASGRRLAAHPICSRSNFCSRR